MISSVYIHIPFCKSICTYCDFCKVLYVKKIRDGYFEALENEVSDRYMHEDISTIYIGGGTPSALDEEDLDKLFKIVKKINLTREFEFTFECNINDIDETLLTKLHENGVNRLSIGIESFNKECLLLMNRMTTFNGAKEKIALCRKMGFNNINLDLIYALPNEDFNILKQDIKLLLKLNPEHISTYSLIYEDNTLLKLKGYTPIDEELELKMYEYIIKKLQQKGYNHYEISNFAKPNCESKHNLNCWNNEEYYGFGLGAAGYFAGVRYQNTKSLTEYKKGNYCKNNEILSKEEKIKYELILGLRKINGINIKDFETKYGISIFDAFDLNRVIKEKDLILKNNYLFINPKKISLMNEILLKII